MKKAASAVRNPLSGKLLNEDLKVYPNPFKESATFYFRINENQTLYMAIYDINGQLKDILIDNRTITNGSYEINYDGSGLTNGLYYCILRGNSTKSIKFVVTEQ